jgi:hypothetical protein
MIDVDEYPILSHGSDNNRVFIGVQLFMNFNFSALPESGYCLIDVPS